MTLRKGDVLVKKSGGKSRRVQLLDRPRRTGAFTYVDVLNLNGESRSWVMHLDDGNPPEGWEKEEKP